MVELVNLLAWEIMGKKYPTYSGGMGQVIGDLVKAASDIGFPLAATIPFHPEGYFEQAIEDGRQAEHWSSVNPDEIFQRINGDFRTKLEGRDIHLSVFLDTFVGRSGEVPVHFTSTDSPKNTPEDRRIISRIYQGSALPQRLVFGFGAINVAKELSLNISKFHVNEGHTAFAPVAFMPEVGWNDSKVREKFVGTTHTPLPTGHEEFPYDDVRRLVGERLPHHIGQLGGYGCLNTTRLMINLCSRVNGVSRIHGVKTREMFPGSNIQHITNGVHAFTWTCPEISDVLDRHIPEWRNDPQMISRAHVIPDNNLWDAHMKAKKMVVECVNEHYGANFDNDTLTICIASRAAAYKRANLIASDISALVDAADDRAQFIFAGKAHPYDGSGKDVVASLVYAVSELNKRGIRAVFVPNYEVDLAKLLVAGVDLWTNTPKLHIEACKTSPAKAAKNFVQSWSTLDGWAFELLTDGFNGYVIGFVGANEQEEHADMMHKLKHVIIPTFYKDRPRWIWQMKNCAASIGSYMDAERMLKEYIRDMYNK